MLNSRESFEPAVGSAQVSASEPTSLFVLKSLLYPIVPVASLAAALALWREPLAGHYFLVAVLAFFAAAELLDSVPIDIPRQRSLALAALLDISARWLVIMGFIWALLEIAGIGHRLSTHVLITWAISTPIAIWIGRLTASRVVINHSRANERRAVIVGATELGLKLAHAIAQSSSHRIRLAGYFDNRKADRLPNPCHSKMLGRVEEVRDYVAAHRVELVYITLPMARQPRMIQLLESLRDSTASIYFVPDLTLCDLVQPRFDQVNGVPVLAVCESPFYGLRGIAKRASDIVMSAIAIALLSPVMLSVAAAVSLTSRGPIIFKQRRYGLDGKSIVVYKFRSMTVTEDGDKAYTQVTRNDARVTPVGAFIRATSLDELPQLFNVLEGTMSIVGPRPHAVSVNEQYRRLIPGYMVRHKVKPGITGWAQVNGFRGGDDLGSMRQRIAFDLEYLQHWSLAFDLLIMFKTAFVVWTDRHAY
jgi:putative colanic acid biosysnthesis UDP-glucose lipid carrier transferase